MCQKLLTLCKLSYIILHHFLKSPKMAKHARKRVGARHGVPLRGSVLCRK